MHSRVEHVDELRHVSIFVCCSVQGLGATHSRSSERRTRPSLPSSTRSTTNTQLGSGTAAATFRAPSRCRMKDRSRLAADSAAVLTTKCEVPRRRRIDQVCYANISLSGHLRQATYYLEGISFCIFNASFPSATTRPSAVRVSCCAPVPPDAP